MPAVTLTGYVAGVENNRVKLVGVEPTAWEGLEPWYFMHGTLKRVSRDKKNCTVFVHRTTQLVKKGERVDNAAEFHSIPVRVVADIKKYSFGAVEGWTLNARKITSH